ncbi:hypothetical protein N9242_05295 [Vicingaceae bacterium]|nr:hypothetical protein [Vicingaceae bacterium]
MTDPIRILKKVILVVLVLLMIYFGLGFAACIGIILIEASTHQLSLELGNDYPVWIIYLAMSIFAMICAGLFIACKVGHYYLKKSTK